MQGEGKEALLLYLAWLVITGLGASQGCVLCMSQAAPAAISCWLSSPGLDCLVDSLTLLYFDRALVKC